MQNLENINSNEVNRLNQVISEHQRDLSNTGFFNKKKKSDLKKAIGVAYFQIGHITNDEASYTRSIEESTEALRLLNDKKSSGIIQRNLAMAYARRGKLTNNLEDFTKALRANDAATRTRASQYEQGSNYFAIGSTYLLRAQLTNSLSDYMTAANFHNSASTPQPASRPLTLQEQSLNQQNLGTAHTGLWNITKNVQHLGLAIHAFTKALRLTTDQSQVGLIWQNLGSLYCLHGQQTNSVDDYNNAVTSCNNASLFPLSPTAQSVNQNNLNTALSTLQLRQSPQQSAAPHSFPEHAPEEVRLETPPQQISQLQAQIDHMNLASPSRRELVRNWSRDIETDYELSDAASQAPTYTSRDQALQHDTQSVASTQPPAYRSQASSQAGPSTSSLGYRRQPAPPAASNSQNPYNTSRGATVATMFAIMNDSDSSLDDMTALSRSLSRPPIQLQQDVTVSPGRMYNVPHCCLV